jgi:hypothetical protein
LIETKIKGCTIEPPTETVVYARRYPTWEIGVVMAMEEALARIYEMYSKEIFDIGTPFHLFGRRNFEGWPMRTPGNHATVSWTEVQLEDMEAHVYNIEHLLLDEMDATNNAKDLLRERQEKIEQLEDIIQKLKDNKKALEAANNKLAFKAEAHEVQIAGLQGQCAYLNQHLKKFDPWPAKKERPLAIKDKESTQRNLKRTPRSKWCPSLMKKRLLWRRAVRNT